MGALLALASALCYGIADFTGGLLSRRGDFAAITLAGQVGGLALTLIVAPIATTTALRPSDLAWGAVSGLGTAVGMLFLYRGLARGAMSVVVPITAVGGVALPVLVGVALLGDRPSTGSWLGIAVAVPALWLVSHTRHRTAASTTGAGLDGLVAGAGIAVQYIALAQAGPHTGIWPIVAGRLAATLTILPPATVNKRPSLSPLRTLSAAGTGAIAASALIFYLAATRQQLVVIAVVLSCLYPAVPVLLGITALRERLAWQQTLGLAASAAAIALLTTGR